MSKTYTEEEVREIIAKTERHMADSLAMAAGLADRVGGVEDLLGLMSTTANAA